MAHTEGEVAPGDQHPVLRLSCLTGGQVTAAALTWTNATRFGQWRCCSLVFLRADCIACDADLMDRSTNCHGLTTNCHKLCPDAYDCIVLSLHTVTDVPGKGHSLIPGRLWHGGRTGPGPALPPAMRCAAARRGMRICATLWERWEEAAAGSALGGKPGTSGGRLAQRESASFTPRRSLVRSQYRPPAQRLCGSSLRSRREPFL
jgi:hypothetical protein